MPGLGTLRGTTWLLERKRDNVTIARLDEINLALGRRYPHLPNGLISRRATLAYLRAPALYVSRNLASTGDGRIFHEIWLAEFPVDEIAALIDIDRYLALELRDERAALRREHDELDEVHACLEELISGMSPYESCGFASPAP